MPESSIDSSVVTAESKTSTLIATTVRMLVAHPGSVHIQSLSDGSLVVFVLTVHPDDIGKVIGDQGRTARSLRALLNAVSIRRKLHFELDIQAARM